MIVNKWDNVPSGTPACIYFMNSPCCGCKDCCKKSIKKRLNNKLELEITLYDDGDVLTLFIDIYDWNSRKTMSDLELSSVDSGLSYYEAKVWFKNIIDVFLNYPDKQLQSTTLDKFYPGKKNKQHKKN